MIRDQKERSFLSPFSSSRSATTTPAQATQLPLSPAPLTPATTSIVSGKGRQNNPCNNNATRYLPAYFPATTDLHFRRKDRQNSPCNSNATCHLPAYFSATTDLHFRRHHDQKNHLDLFYTKVLTGTPFVILKNPHFYYGSSSFHAKSRLLFMNNNRVGSGPVWCPA